MPLAYSYIRFSTRRQADGDSLRRQTEQAIRFIAKHNSDPQNADNQLTLASDGQQYIDAGVSAFRSKNKHEGALRAFIDAVQDRTIAKGSWLLIENLDRLSRDMIDRAVSLLFDIVRAGITVATVGDGFVYHLGNIGKTETTLRATLFLTLAYEESVKKSGRYKDMWVAKRAAAAEGQKIRSIGPSWLKRIDGDSFEVIEENANVVREIFRLAETGMPQSRIAVHLNEQGVPPFKKSARGWKQSNVFHILEARTVFGEFQAGIAEYDESGRKQTVKQGEPIADYYPAIIPQETFLLVQEIRKASRRKGFGNSGRQPGVANLLTGVARCGVCDGPMVIRSGTAHGTRKRYLVCDHGKRRAPNTPCNSASWRYEEIEDIVLNYMKGVDFAKLVSRAVSGKLSESATDKLVAEQIIINDELVKLNKRLERIRDAILDEEDSDERLDLKERRIRYSSEKRNNEARRAQIDAELQQLRSQTAVLDASRSAIAELNALEGLDLETARNLIRRAIASSVSSIRICVDHNVKRRQYWKQDGWTDGQIELAIAKEGRTVGYGKGVLGMVDNREKSIAIEFRDGTLRYIHGIEFTAVDNGKARVQMLADEMAVAACVLDERDDEGDAQLLAT